METPLVHVYHVNIPVKPVHQMIIVYPATIIVSTELKSLTVPVSKGTIQIIPKLVKSAPNSTVNNAIQMEFASNAKTLLYRLLLVKKQFLLLSWKRTKLLKKRENVINNANPVQLLNQVNVPNVSQENTDYPLPVVTAIKDTIIIMGAVYSAKNAPYFANNGN